jgi:hypothetical protein
MRTSWRSLWKCQTLIDVSLTLPSHPAMRPEQAHLCHLGVGAGEIGVAGHGSRTASLANASAAAARTNSRSPACWSRRCRRVPVQLERRGQRTVRLAESAR